jgi:hypothetical protein
MVGIGRCPGLSTRRRARARHPLAAYAILAVALFSGRDHRGAAWPAPRSVRLRSYVSAAGWKSAQYCAENHVGALGKSQTNRAERNSLARR